jgi:predicted ATPase/DNA-binding CsgD family transcriptional regulator
MKAAKRVRQGTSADIPNNLPRYLTSFVGRSGELTALKSLLQRSRMVTLLGPGGAGKSRLAAELAQTFPDLWPGGAWWVSLAPVDDPRRVPGAVVAALELPGRRPAKDVAIAWLSARRALLVIDNCEHLVAACAAFCQAVLERCPELTIITTSREALRVPGETHWAVAALPAPDAVHLFEARARLVVPHFRVTESNLDRVTQICERLDRMPLAIELAAARVGMMTEGEILSQLSDRFRLLTGGDRTAPERQQTMSATVDWSYRLLTDGEAQLFRRLSVFPGGFALDSVQAVCGGDLAGRVLELLTRLVQKSMVVADAAAGSGTRYRLLESQLAYANDRLQETSEVGLMRRRHYEHFLDLLTAKSFAPFGGQPSPSLAEVQRIARESGNLWAAVGWARNNADDMGLNFGTKMSLANYVDIAQARRLLADLLDRSPEKGLPRVHALRTAAWLAYVQGDNEAVTHLSEAALPLARELGDVEALGLALMTASIASTVNGELDAAAEHMEEANSHLQGSNNRLLASMIRNNLGWIALQRGDYSAARDMLLECVSIARAEGHVWLTMTFLEGLAWAQWGLNDHETAAASFKEALELSRALIDKLEIIVCLLGLFCVADLDGDHQRALRLAAAANRLSGEWSLSVVRWIEMHAEESQIRARSKMGTHKSEKAWAQGWAMTVDQVVDYALGQGEPETAIDAGPLSRRQRAFTKIVVAGMTNRQAVEFALLSLGAEPDQVPLPQGPLTVREVEVATLVAEGLGNREIGTRLFISVRTAEYHVEQIRNKLGFHSRSEIAAWITERRQSLRQPRMPPTKTGSRKPVVHR